MSEAEIPVTLTRTVDTGVVLGEAQQSAQKIVRYRRDFRAFASEQLRIGDNPFNFWPCQIPLLESIERQFEARGFARCVWLKARQVGASTLAESLVAWRTMLWPHVNALVLADQAERARTLFEISRTFYDHLDDDIRPVGRYITKRELVFANPSQATRKHDPGLRSRIVVESAHKKNIAIGANWQVAHLSECARFPDPAFVLDGVIPAVHRVPGTIIIMESSAEMAGTWYRDFCEASMRGDTAFEFTFVPWFLQPEYCMPLNVGESIEFSANERHIVAEFGLNPGHIKWMREKLGEMGNDWDLFRQSFPLCVSGDTRVGTNLGLIRIQAQGVSELSGSRVVKEWLPQGVHETVLVETKDGYRVQCTPNHPFVVGDAFIEAKDLLEDMVLTLEPPRLSESMFVHRWISSPGVQSSVLVTEELSAFLGYYLGDGSFDGHCVEIASDSRDMDVVEDIERVVGIVASGYLTSRGTRPSITRRHRLQGAIGVRSFTRDWIHLLSQFEIAEQYSGKGLWHRVVRVPEAIFRSPQPCVRRFLSALFESDGYAGNRQAKVVFCSKGEQFCRDIQLLLLAFGIKGRLRRERQSRPYIDGSLGYKTMLYLSASEATLFHEKIGFVSARKQNGRRAYPSGKVRLRHVLSDRVKSVTSAGCVDVYDFRVAPDHLHDTNGILTHNTVEDAWVTPGAQVFPAKSLRELRHGVRPPMRMAEVHSGPRILDAPQGKLWIWDEPEQGKAYDIGIDVAMGQGRDDSMEEDLDSSVACVLQRGSNKQVAEWTSRAVDPFELANVLYWLGKYYNTAQIAVETNGIGGGTNQQLSKMGYSNNYVWRYRDEVVPRYSRKTGWETNSKSKPWLVGFASHEMVNGRVHIASESLLRELEMFVQKGPNEWGAVAGHHDDRAIAWMIALLTSDDECFEKYYGLQKLVSRDTVSGGAEKREPEPWECDRTFRRMVGGREDEPWE